MSANGHAFWAVRDLFDLVSGPDLSLLDYPKIETRPSVGYEEGRHFWMVETEANPIARDARLADLEDAAADAKPVSNTDLGIGQAIDCEVLSEIPIDKVLSPEIGGPVAVGFELIDHERALLAAMAGKIGLAIANEIKPPGENAPLYRLLPDRRPDGFSAPFHLTRQPNIHRDDDTHVAALLTMHQG